MVAAVRASAYIGGTKEQAPKRRGWQGGPGMTGAAPVPEAREISLSSGGVRSLGRVGIGFGAGVAIGISRRVIMLGLGEVDGQTHTADAAAEPGKKVV